MESGLCCLKFHQVYLNHESNRQGMMPRTTLDEMLDNQALVRRYGPVSVYIGGSRGGGEEVGWVAIFTPNTTLPLCLLKHPFSGKCLHKPAPGLASRGLCCRICSLHPTNSLIPTHPTNNLIPPPPPLRSPFFNQWHNQLHGLG